MPERSWPDPEKVDELKVEFLPRLIFGVTQSLYPDSAVKALSQAEISALPRLNDSNTLSAKQVPGRSLLYYCRLARLPDMTTSRWFPRQIQRQY